METTKSKKKLKVILVLVIAAVVLLLGYYLWQNGTYLKVPKFLSGSSVYQAVFLSNGQVYFGRAMNINSNYVILKDVYYLQVNQTLQPAQGKQSATPQQTLSLAKLGISELHKPKDEMKINRDHVIFIEDLEDDSQVVQAIDRYKETQ